MVNADLNNLHVMEIPHFNDPPQAPDRFIRDDNSKRGQMGE